eukprot:scaffold68964_cov78-Cyclotella_meneghiniana.AAC.6
MATLLVSEQAPCQCQWHDGQWPPGGYHGKSTLTRPWPKTAILEELKDIFSMISFLYCAPMTSSTQDLPAPELLATHQYHFNESHKWIAIHRDEASGSDLSTGRTPRPAQNGRPSPRPASRQRQPSSIAITRSPITTMAPRPQRSDTTDSDPKSDHNAIDESPDQTSSSWTKAQHLILTSLLPLISQQDDLYSLLYNGDLTKKEQLVTTCRQLFRYVEYLAELQTKLKQQRTEESRDETVQDDTTPEELLPCSLSGLHTLYTGNDDDDESQQQQQHNTKTNLIDMETIWGQVDLQNNALLPRLKKMIRKLVKSVDGDEIRLLDMGDGMSEEGEDMDDGDDDSGKEDINESEEGSVASNLDENGDSEDDDEEEMDEDAKRIRERMEKVRHFIQDI